MQLRKSYMYYTSTIKPELCKKIIAHGLSKMVVDEAKGIPKEASTFDNKEKGGISKDGSQVSNTLMSGGMTRETMAKKGIDIQNAYVRDSHISWLNDKWIYDILHPYVHHANREAGWKWHWDYSESYQFTKYAKKQFYGWHADGSSDHLSIYKPAIKITTGKVPTFKPVKRDSNGKIILDANGKGVPDMDKPNVPTDKKNKRLISGWTDNPHMWDKVRKITMVLNLTNPDNYAGGNLKLDLGPHAGKKRFHVCQEIRPQGSIIIFPSFTYHCVTPVTRGTRYSLVNWCLGKPWY